MNWTDIVSIVFVCVTANHLGLVKAIEDVSKMEIPIINCPKCSSFWLVLAYGLWVGFSDIPSVLAISFLASYAAIWLELFEGLIDKIYLKIYEKVITTSNDDTAAADAGNGDPAGALSEL